MLDARPCRRSGKFSPVREMPADHELAGHRIGGLHGFCPGSLVNMQLVGHLFLAAGESLS